jgi:hypothetical protein
VRLCKHIPMKKLEVWHPRYHDQRVLLAAHKIGQHNSITFTKSQSMGTEPYYISGVKARQFKKENNGRIDCYAVPISELEPLEINKKCEHEL